MQTFTIRMQSASKDKHIHIRLARNTLVSGSVASVTDMESRFGLMEHATRATGKITELMALASSRTSMAMFTKETGSMTRRMDKEFTFM